MTVCTLVVQFVKALPTKCSRILFAAIQIKCAGFIYWWRRAIVNCTAVFHHNRLTDDNNQKYLSS